MDIWNALTHLILHWTTPKFRLRMFLCLYVYFSFQLMLSDAGSMLKETFEGTARNDIAGFECGVSGWSVQQSNEGGHALAMCTQKCAHNLTVLHGAYCPSQPCTVKFNYALNVQDVSTAPVLKMYCDVCSPSGLLWTSSSSEPLTNGEWLPTEVSLKILKSGSFNLIFEANIQTGGQVIGLDNVIIVQTGKAPTKDVLPVSSTPLSFPTQCLDSTTTATRLNPPTPDQFNTYGTTSVPQDAEPENTFGPLDNETTLLFAQILAILSVTVCLTTVGIHCLIWKKQKKLHRGRSIVPMRHKSAALETSHDSMLLEMNLIASDEPDQPCSNSLNDISKIQIQQVQNLDTPGHGDKRRATVSCGSSPAHSAAVRNDSDDDSDEDKQRPHPRTKSLPSRPPINVYESIDEVGKYQPLTFGKRPAPRPPGVPVGKRLNARTRGVQNLAAVRKYRPSSVQYEEVGNRKNGLLAEEPRDRSKSACHYDYIKRKSQSPRRKYGQTPHPKGRAPAPPTNQLYDKPVRKLQAVVKVDSAPTILIQNQESSAGETDRDSVQHELPVIYNPYDKPSTSAQNIHTRAAVESQYFTLEPPEVTYATSDDSDDEHESEKDISRFEDAEESHSTALHNGAIAIPKRPLSVSKPIDIPPTLPPTFTDYVMESSHL